MCHVSEDEFQHWLPTGSLGDGISGSRRVRERRFN